LNGHLSFIKRRLIRKSFHSLKINKPKQQWQNPKRERKQWGNESIRDEGRQCRSGPAEQSAAKQALLRTNPAGLRSTVYAAPQTENVSKYLLRIPTVVSASLRKKRKEMTTRAKNVTLQTISHRREGGRMITPSDCPLCS